MNKTITLTITQPEESLKGFAMAKGWTPEVTKVKETPSEEVEGKINTTTEVVDNPVTYEQFITGMLQKLVVDAIRPVMAQAGISALKKQEEVINSQVEEQLGQAITTSVE